MMMPEHVRFWRFLNETDQNSIIRAYESGTRRRNWSRSKELYEAIRPLQAQLNECNLRISQNKQFLADTDHRVIKFTEGIITEEAFAPDREARAEARRSINAAESEIAAVSDAVVSETERVRDEILSTWKPKYAGKFVGKSKVVLEDS